jgi:hypothetical protein
MLTRSVLAMLVLTGAVVAQQPPTPPVQQGLPPAAPPVCTPAANQDPWVLTVTNEGGPGLIQVQAAGLSATCATLTLPVAGCTGVVVKVADYRIHLQTIQVAAVGQAFEFTASADRVSRSANGCVLTLEGNARLDCQVPGRSAAVSADRIVVNLATGAVETNLMPAHPPQFPTPVVPCVTGSNGRSQHRVPPPLPSDTRPPEPPVVPSEER